MAFFDELKRRNVIRVGLAYAVVGWVIAQVGEFAAETFGAPDWVMKVFVVFLLLGLPLALFFAWVFELTPEGIKRESGVDRSASITRQTGHKLNRLIIAVLILAVGILLVDKFYQRSSMDEVIATAGRHSIAVLPFVNMSDDSDHFADGSPTGRPTTPKHMLCIFTRLPCRPPVKETPQTGPCGCSTRQSHTIPTSPAPTS